MDVLDASARRAASTRRPEVPERDLVLRAREGDRGAFDELATRLVPRLLGSARRVLRDPSDAEEAVADALWKAWRRLAEFRMESSLSTWAHRILLHVAIDRQRQRARDARHGTLAANPERIERERTPLGRLASEEDGRRLRRAVASLPEAQRLVVVLTAWEGLDLREAARLLAVRYATAKSNLHHAREALRRRLGGGDER